MEAYHVPGTLKILRGKTGMKQTKISCFSGTCVLVESDRHVNVASLVAQRLKNLPIMRETWVPSLGWEDPLEKGMATHSSILAWRIPWTEEPGGLQSMGM